MPDGNFAEASLARWLAQGATSQTHPLLGHVLDTFFLPLGIEADWLEAEPFSALESGWGCWWLRRPRWAAGRFDPQSPAAGDFRFLCENPALFAVGVQSDGILSIAAGRDSSRGEALALLGANGGGWPAIRHSIRAAHAAESFIYAAAGILLAGDPAAKAFAAGEDEAFLLAIRDRLAQTPARTENSRARGANPATGRATDSPAAAAG
jgi:hypothetical protein